jgi:hypothetical protein
MRFFFPTTLFVAAALPALASLTYTCDPSIDATHAGTCAALQGSTVAGVYNSVFNLSSANINIYITYFAADTFGESFTNLTPVPYTQYYSQLGLSTHDPAAFATLPGVDPFDPTGNVDITPALASVLGITTNGANTAGVMSDGTTNCTLGSAGCYNGVIMLGESSVTSVPWYYPLSPSDPTDTGLDFFYIAEHETNEILGTVSCVGLVFDSGTGMNVPGNQCTNTIGGTDASPADLFRYASPGIRTFTATANGSPAYFSTDAGVTDISDYNNSPGGGDYGDWSIANLFSGGHVKVQDTQASGSINADITNDGGSEIDVLNAVGFNLNSSTPEPGTSGLLGCSLTILAAISIRRRSRN